MSRVINFYLLFYSIGSLKREKYKNIFVFLVMSLLVALLASTFFLSNAMKADYNALIDSYPDIVLQNQKAGINATIKSSIADKLLFLDGVKSSEARVYGSYYFNRADSELAIIGVNMFTPSLSTFINTLMQKHSLNEGEMLVSSSAKQLLSKHYYKEYFNFVKSDGSLQKMQIQGVFKNSKKFPNKNILVMLKSDARKIFNYKEGEARDIAIDVANADEVASIALKIGELYPSMKVILKEDLRVKYENLYNLRSGFFLTIFIITFFTFFIIIYDKLSGLNSEKRREIGVLKAIGWRVGDVLNAKLYEGVILSLSAYLTGIFLAFVYVYLLDAPLLKNIFLNNYNLLQNYTIHFSVDYETLALLFFLSVPIYIAATVIPSWKIATLDADEVMR